MKSAQLKHKQTHPLSKLILGIIVNTAEHTEAFFPFHCVEIDVIDTIVKRELLENSHNTLTYRAYSDLDTKEAFERYIRSLTNTLRNFQIHQE